MENKTNINQIKLMTCEETAKLLNIKTETIYSWLFYKQLPKTIYRKLGRKPIFIYDEVANWSLNGAELQKRCTR